MGTMKIIQYEFIRDLEISVSKSGTGEVEIAPYGRGPDMACYVIGGEIDEPVARAQFMRDYQRYNPTNIAFKFIDCKGIIKICRRI